MPETCILNYSQLFGGGIIAAVSAAAGYLSARRIAEFNARRVAVAKFRSVFAPALAIISLGFKSGYRDGTPTKDFFDEAILSHAAAIEEFRPFVSDGVAYQEAWEDYKKIIANDSIKNGGAGWDTGIVESDNDEVVDYMPIVKQKIDNILKFAEH